MRNLKKLAVAVAALGMLAGCGDGKGGAGGSSKKPDTEDQKVLYALGAQIGKSVDRFQLTPDELEYVKAGLTDVATGKKADFPVEQYFMKVQELYRSRAEKFQQVAKQRAEAEKAKSKQFLDDAAKEQGAVKTETGLIYKEVTAGTGESPKPTDRVKVNYRGTLTDGTEFDSSAKNGGPATFPLMGVIRCWTEGLQKMKVGGKAKLVCPSDLAYGDQGQRDIPGGATLVFDVELLEILPSAMPPNGMMQLPINHPAMDAGPAAPAPAPKK